MNKAFNNLITSKRIRAFVIWLFFVVMTLMTVIAPVLAEGATGRGI
ncbi:MAG: hypothetical protein AAFV98_10755 [Chloroflexota bacterium]